MRIGDRKVREFDQYAASYAALLEDPLRDRFARDPLHFHRRKWLVLRRLLQQANVSIAEKRWLDVGCGRGELLELAGHHFAQAMGCDPSAEMISQTDSLHITHQPSLSELPFEDASVDLVTAVCVYHHVHGVARTLLSREIRRVLAPGGLCCIIEHNPLNPVTRAIVRRCPVDVDAELLTAQEMRTLLRSAGLAALTVEYFLYVPEKMFDVAGQVEAMLRKVPFGGQYAVFTRTQG
jgi:SAM-dependent methyltransferase